jgi:hypothetical protein
LPVDHGGGKRLLHCDGTNANLGPVAEPAGRLRQSVSELQNRNVA